MDNPLFIHVFRLPFAIISTLMAFGIIGSTLKSKPAKLVMLGILITLEVIVSIYLLRTYSSFWHDNNDDSENNFSNFKKGSSFWDNWEDNFRKSKDEFDQTSRVMSTTIIVVILKLCVSSLFPLCKYVCNGKDNEGEAATEAPQSSYGNHSSKGLPASSQSSVQQLPPTYHSAIWMTSNKDC